VRYDPTGAVRRQRVNQILVDFFEIFFVSTNVHRKFAALSMLISVASAPGSLC